MLPSNLAKRACLLLFLLILAFYLFGLGYLPLMGPDEPRYAQVAREMFLRGDLITPTLAGHTWFEKPVLLYWMMQAAFLVFGFSEAAARLGPALCGLLALGAVYLVAKRVEETSGDPGLRGFSCWSVVILATMPGTIVFSRGASFDIVVTMAITWALSFFFLSLTQPNQRRRRWMLVGFYVFIGVALLAKGLVGIVLPFGIVFLFQMLRRKLPERQLLTSLVWGLPLALGIAAVWYAPVIAKHGWSFIDEFFIQHHLARYVSNKYRHPQPLPYYFVIIFPMTLPWIIFGIDGLRRLRHWDWNGSSALGQLRLLALAWVLFPLLFFTLSGSKLPAYILPILPPLALLSAERLSRFIARQNSYRAMQFVGATLIVASVAAAIVSVTTPGLKPPSAALVIAPLLLAGFIVLIVQRRRLAAVAVALAIPISFILALQSAVPTFVPTQTTKYLLDEATARGYGLAPVYFLHETDRSAEFYAAGRLVYDAHGEPIKFEGAGQILDAASPRQEPLLVIVPSRYVNQVLGLKTASGEVIADNGSMAVAVLKRR